MQEFNYIEKYFKKLVKYKGALGLQDDVCFIDPVNYSKLVINCDSIVEGTHFFSKDSAESVANKAFVSNVSDLYAKGLKPLYYTLAISFNPFSFNEGYIKAFTKQLQELQDFYGVSLIGGDTTVNDAKLCITINMFALTNNNIATRAKAQENENIYLTRNLGDSYLGYLALSGKAKKFSFLKKDEEYFINKYHYLKLDNFNFIKNVFPFISSSMDISDGLLIDLNHICKQSNLGAILNYSSLPFSSTFLKYKSLFQANLFDYISQGGDYNLLFTAKQEFNNKIQEITKQNNTKVSLIGQTNSKKGLYARVQNSIKPLVVKGYSHSL